MNDEIDILTVIPLSEIFYIQSTVIHEIVAVKKYNKMETVKKVENEDKKM